MFLSVTRRSAPSPNSASPRLQSSDSVRPESLGSDGDDGMERRPRRVAASRQTAADEQPFISERGLELELDIPGGIAEEEEGQGIPPREVA
jgi:hypothetical protein